MTPPAASPETTPDRTRRLILIGCGALVLLGCCIAAAVGAYFLLRDRFSRAEQPAVAYILDTSPRMSQSSEEGTRLSVAQAILAEIVRPGAPDLTTGLRVFGSGAQAAACEDTELVVPFAPANQSTIAQELLGLSVGGAAESALAEAMVEAIRDLNAARGPHFIVVVTGGADSCKPQAGEFVAQEAERAGIELQTYVVGFQVSPEEAQALKTLTEALPGGVYQEAQDAAALRTVLGGIQARIEQATIASRAPEQASADRDRSAGGEGEPPEGGEPSEPGDYESQTACDHPYFPLRQGATWTYDTDGYTYTWAVGGVSGDLSNATASILMTFAEGSVTYEWSCGPDGVYYYTLGAFAFAGAEDGISMQITSQSGAPLLPAEAFQPGASWTSAFTITSEANVAGVSMVTTIEVTESNTAGDPTTISTGLGSFEAIPVASSGTSTTTTDFGVFSSSYTSTCWFAYGVGWIRCETDTEGMTSVTQLVSYSIP